MKKIIIAAVALAALAGAASAAGNRSYDLRDLETVNGYSSDGAFLPTTKGGDYMIPVIKKPASTVIDHTGEHQNSTN
jgi:opacity protein-like surface antigen